MSEKFIISELIFRYAADGCICKKQMNVAE